MGGDQAEQIYDQTFSRIFRFFYYRGLNADDVQDLAQEVYFRYFSKYGNNDHEVDVAIKLIYKIASNVYCEWCRNLKKNSYYEFDEGIHNMSIMDELDDPDFETKIFKLGSLLEEAMNKLPEQQSQLLKLRFIEGLTRKDTAERLNIKESNIHVYQQRAIKKLQKLVAP